MSTSPSQRLKNIGRFASANLYRQVLGFITTLFRPTLLGPELFGLWSLLNVLPMYASYGHLGSRTTMRYQMPKLLAQTDSGDQLTRCKHNAFMTAIWVNGLIAVLALAYALLLAESTEQLVGWSMIALVVVLECVYEHAIAELKGQQNFRLISYMTYLRYSLNFIFTGIFIYLWGFYGALLALVLGILLSLAQMSRSHRVRWPTQFNPTEQWSMIKTGAPILALDLVALVLKTLDKLLIALLMGTQALGYYALASMLLGPVMNIPGASREVTEQALMAEHHQLSVSEQLDKHLFAPLRYSAYLMPLLIGLVYFSLPAFVAIALPKFQAALVPIQLMLLGSFFLALSYPCRGLIVANQWQLKVLKFACLPIGLSLILVCSAIELGYGLAGVAISSGIAYGSLFAVLIGFMLVQFKQTVRAYFKPLAELLLPFLFMLVVIYGCHRVLAALNWGPLASSLSAMLVFVVAYSPLLYLGIKCRRLSLPVKLKQLVDKRSNR